MECNNPREKGTDQKSAPKSNQPDYNKIYNMCLCLVFIAIIMICIACWRNSERVKFLGIGILTGASLIHAGILTNENEE